jgi:hypothetical protein
VPTNLLKAACSPSTISGSARVLALLLCQPRPRRGTVWQPPIPVAERSQIEPLVAEVERLLEVMRPEWIPELQEKVRTALSAFQKDVGR